MPFYVPGTELGDEDIKESGVHKSFFPWEVSSLDGEKGK